MSGKTTAPAFPLLGGDWIKGTARFSAAERGYYIDLLLYVWDSDEPLPASEVEQMQIARCTNRREWRKVWDRLKGKWTEVPGGYRNRRCEAERTRLQNYRDKKSTAGKSGAQNRWHRDSRTNSKTDGKAIAEDVTGGVANEWPSISISTEIDPKDQDRSRAPTTELLRLFDELHQARFETPADITPGKDAAILAALCRKRGVEETTELIRAFFESRDKWVMANGFSVGVFKSQISKLLLKRPKTLSEHLDWKAECQEKHDSRCTNVHFHAAKMAEQEEAKP